MRILVVNGPNLNMLGIREPEIYGRMTYSQLEEYITNICYAEGIEVEIFQSNHEGDLVDKIQYAFDKMDGIIINPAAYTHTSVAILDALKAVSIPSVEVHLSNVLSREDFRKVSYVSMACIKTSTGIGAEGYKQAILFIKKWIKENPKS